jgi:molybdopterin-binding protein
MTPILEASDLVVRHSEKTILKLSHLSVMEGEVLAIIGPNGAGKSTLLRVLGGLERPAHGRLTFRGAPVDWSGNRLQLRRRIATVFAEPLLIDATVAVNVALGCGFHRLSGDETRGRSQRWMERLSIAHLANRQARTLSSGEAQRASLARALVLQPELLLLDEPFSSLDQPMRESLLVELDAILQSERITTIFVTHDRTEALLMGDRLAVMMDGQLLQVDSPERLFRAPATPEVARFVGAETILAGGVVGHDQGLLTVEVGGHKLAIAGEARVGEAVHLCFRPEDFTLMPAESATAMSSARNHLTGRVAHLTRMGALVRVAVDCGVPIVAHVTRSSAEEMELSEGKPIVVTFKASSPHLLRHA